MNNFLFNFKIKIYKILIPHLVKFRYLDILSLLFITCLTKLKSKMSDRKIKHKIIILSKSGGIDDVIESQKSKANDSIAYFACPRIFIVTIFNTIFDNQEYDDTKNFSLKKQN